MSFSVDLWDGFDIIKNQFNSTRKKLKVLYKLLSSYIELETNYCKNIENIYKEYKENIRIDFKLDESFQKVIEIFEFETQNRKIFYSNLINLILDPINAYLEKKKNINKYYTDNLEYRENFNRVLNSLIEKQLLFHNNCRELSLNIAMIEIDSENKNNKILKSKCQKLLEKVKYTKEDYLNCIQDTNKEREKYNYKTEEALNNLDGMYRTLVQKFQEALLNFAGYRLEFLKLLIKKEQNEYNNIHSKVIPEEEILSFIMKNATKEFPMIKIEFCPIKYTSLNKYIKSKFNKIPEKELSKIYKAVKNYFENNDIFKDDLIIKDSDKNSGFFSKKFTFFGKKSNQNDKERDIQKQNKEFLEKYLTNLFTNGESKEINDEKQEKNEKNNEKENTNENSKENTNEKTKENSKENNENKEIKGDMKENKKENIENEEKKLKESEDTFEIIDENTLNEINDKNENENQKDILNENKDNKINDNKENKLEKKENDINNVNEENEIKQKENNKLDSQNKTNNLENNIIENKDKATIEENKECKDIAIITEKKENITEKDNNINNNKDNNKIINEENKNMETTDKEKEKENKNNIVMDGLEELIKLITFPNENSLFYIEVLIKKLSYLRSKGFFKISNNTYNIILSIFDTILRQNPRNDYILKNVLILCQTFYKLENDEKIYLQKGIKNRELFNFPETWHRVINYSMNLSCTDKDLSNIKLNEKIEKINKESNVVVIAYLCDIKQYTDDEKVFNDVKDYYIKVYNMDEEKVNEEVENYMNTLYKKSNNNKDNLKENKNKEENEIKEKYDNKISKNLPVETKELALTLNDIISNNNVDFKKSLNRNIFHTSSLVDKKIFKSKTIEISKEFNFEINDKKSKENNIIMEERTDIAKNNQKKEIETKKSNDNEKDIPKDLNEVKEEDKIINNEIKEIANNDEIKEFNKEKTENNIKNEIIKDNNENKKIHDNNKEINTEIEENKSNEANIQDKENNNEKENNIRDEINNQNERKELDKKEKLNIESHIEKS